MLIEVGLEGEGFVAPLTPEVLEGGMGLHMSAQVRPVRK